MSCTEIEAFLSPDYQYTKTARDHRRSLARILWRRLGTWPELCGNQVDSVRGCIVSHGACAALGRQLFNGQTAWRAGVDGLLARDGKRYAYRLTEKDAKVSLLFILFRKQLCGPLANSLCHHRPAAAPKPNSKLESAFHKADNSIQNIIQLLKAA